MAAACSTKTWQASVTWVATLAPKASTSRASGGGWAATFATFHGLGEGVGPLPLGGGGHPPQQPPPQSPASSAFPAFPPWRLGFVLDKKMRQLQDGGLRKTKETKKTRDNYRDDSRDNLVRMR